jgi:hypothetical protein
MADWMKNLKEDVYKELEERRLQEENQGRLKWSKRQNIQDVYDWLHKYLKDEGIHSFNREVLQSERMRMEITYRENIINNNEFRLDLDQGIFRYEIKANPSEFKIAAKLNEFRHPDWLYSIDGGAFDLEITTEGSNIFVKDQTGKHQKQLNELPQILLTTLYRVSRFKNAD